MDATNHSLSLLIDRVEHDVAILGPIIGDIMWYHGHWMPGRYASEQGNIQDALDLASIADALMTTEGTTTR